MELQTFLLLVLLLIVQYSYCANNKLKSCQAKLKRLQNDYNVLKVAGQCTCNCEGIQGLPGPTGPQGPQGPPGPTGPQLPTTCPHDFINSTEFGSCYKLFTVEPLSWIDALSHCQSMGANLATIESDEEQNFLKEQIQQKNNLKYFWIGLNNLHGYWSWSTMPGQENEPLGKDNYHSWNVDEGQPENNNQHCAEMDAAKSGRNYRWHDDHCMYKHTYICEMKLK
ncbi:unnamed protein product [Owenia fusiformis]|uniref:Uncharacterized protein n=1 Tax=Owenia fusiformis TaxID=6347 RepID=A0A8J1UCS9_OWEFU|nr:unnamed protein product [Owenia fusiformis]